MGALTRTVCDASSRVGGDLRILTLDCHLGTKLRGLRGGLGAEGVAWVLGALLQRGLTRRPDSTEQPRRVALLL